ncbi:MAG: hypothetical protein M1836_007014 [Candelina mexicana]|nr:MAG: hypothetical protein M1836_007014 [Candelina mexicana]
MKSSTDAKKSRNLRTAFLNAPTSNENHEDPILTASTERRREATVYDAVAGRISSNGFIPDRPFTSKYRDTLSSTEVAAPPEEVLFRRKNAPTRYEENDTYFASCNLLPHQKLPESDLLKAIHTYASDFYECATRNPSIDFKSMDETALIALGILLEEATGECLGQTGDLAFVEGEEDERPKESAERPLMGQTTKGLGSVIARPRKRRKIQHDKTGKPVKGVDQEIDDKAHRPGLHKVVKDATVGNNVLRERSLSSEGLDSDESRESMKADGESSD